MRPFVEALCSRQCAGRSPGTAGGEAGRRLVVEAFRAAGLDPVEQPVPGCGGANVVARLPGTRARWVLVAAHHDHLGTHGGEVYAGADDNAAAVAILVEAARALAPTPIEGRGVLVVAFDGEEPPHFLSPAMGSEHFARHPPVPLESIDLMICMDLVGHALGAPGLPAEMRDTLFALGAERSQGTAPTLDAIEEPGVHVRRLDAEIIPPLSDYAAFWDRRVPFVFLTCGRWAHYHTPQDTPEKLDYGKMAATARWLERFVRASCARPEPRVAFTNAADDASSLRSLVALTRALEPVSPDAAMARQRAEALLARCRPDGVLPRDERDRVRALVAMLEARLA